jgi:hypothetical protein
MKYLHGFLLLNLFITANGQGNRPLHIGDSVLCGIVFYIDSATIGGRQHGLMCAFTDQSAGIQWYNGKYITTKATRNVKFDIANARRVINSQGPGNYAASICDNPIDSCTGWYLPSKTELLLMFNNLSKKGKGGFANTGYWSSVEAGTKDSTSRPQKKAWIVDFFDGKSFTNDKINKNHVRAVREFRN